MVLTKPLADFIAEHRSEINEAINGVIYRYDGNGGRGTVPTPARSEGVDI